MENKIRIRRKTEEELENERQAYQGGEGSAMLRAAVGMYLAYLAVDMFRKRADIPAGHEILAYGAMALFFVGGIFTMVSSVLAIVRIEKEKRLASEEAGEEAAPELPEDADEGDGGSPPPLSKYDE